MNGCGPPTPETNGPEADSAHNGHGQFLALTLIKAYLPHICTIPPYNLHSTLVITLS